MDDRHALSRDVELITQVLVVKMDNNRVEAVLIAGFFVVEPGLYSSRPDRHTVEWTARCILDVAEDEVSMIHLVLGVHVYTKEHEQKNCQPSSQTEERHDASLEKESFGSQGNAVAVWA